MPLRLAAGAAGFVAAFDRLVQSARETVAQVDSVAAAIVEDVQRRGDAAVHAYTAKFDRVKPGKQGLRLGAAPRELSPIAPDRVGAVGQHDACGIAAVPTVFGQANLLNGGFTGERRQRGAGVHGSGFQ